MKMSEKNKVETEYVRALYDYSYINDEGQKIEMKAYEKYELVDSTTQEWWQVRRGHNELFYVPANYIEKVSNNGNKKDDRNKPVAESQGQRSAGEQSPMVTFHPVPETQPVSSGDDGDENIYVNSQDLASESEHVPGVKTVIQITSTGSASKITQEPTEDSGDYVNLEEYRKNAGIGQKEVITDVFFFI